MAKDLSISYLLDFYGQMLTDKQREVTEFYYNDDLSLAEIADHCHITRHILSAADRQDSNRRLRPNKPP